PPAGGASTVAAGRIWACPCRPAARTGCSTRNAAFRQGTGQLEQASEMVNRDTDQPYEGAFLNGEHRYAIRVHFEDTDAGGVFYHASYLRFMERAGSDILRL